MGTINSYNIIHYGDVLTSCFKLGELSQSRLATGRGENSVVFNGFFVFFNVAKFCQILTLFAQVMTSEANGANYGGYIRYRP